MMRALQPEGINMEIETLSPAELDALAVKAAKAAADKRKAARSELRATILAMVRDAGLTIQDLFDVKPDMRRTVKPKYWHPTNPDISWSGRGTAPPWARVILQAGEELPTKQAGQY
jgi:DNA-binding protein H-NS